MSAPGRSKGAAVLRVVLVDDEPLARDELGFLLGQLGGVQVVGEAADAAEAIALCDRHRPEAAFVDLRMPGPDGMALAEALSRRSPPVAVVVVSAHEEGASRAFDAGVVDYLLKPVRLERLRRALERLRGRLGGATPAPLDRIALKRRGSWVVRSVDEVLCFEVRDELVWAVTREDRFTVDFTLGELERRLPPDRFFRTHRSALVRLEAIAALEPSGSGTFEVVLDHPEGLRVPLARERAKALRARIPFVG